MEYFIQAVDNSGNVAQSTDYGNQFTAGAPAAPTSLSINGLTTRPMSSASILTAMIGPAAATPPITYTWRASGQSPVTQVGNLTSTVVFSWSVTGTKVLTVTAENVGGVVTSTHSIMIEAPSSAPVGPTGITISGPAAGFVNSSL